ncbi:larval cuticle protein LCP-17 [Cephus cinctus]|uniref:Larval cuticle protein LCP-17 n=1 Tax=Cephus cinctus TaxID=211228 RepID=A0AAJ7BVX9_CEPCN|nr:larval cuticle protein LCP-17 [Cephus cinctus]
MKSLVLAIVLCISACLADVSHIVGKPVGILQDEKDLLPDGSFNFQYETENGIKASAQGNSDGTVVGSFQWIAPDGTPVHMTYTADQNGYKVHPNPSSSSHPVPQPIVSTLGNTHRP